MATNYRWDKEGIPHNGWRITGEIQDLGAGVYSRCEMCGRPHVRYLHTVYHKDLNETLSVGCVCAEKLDANYDGVAAENNYKKRAALLNKKHKTLTKDNITVQYQKIAKDLVAVVALEDKWFWIAEREDDIYDSRLDNRYFMCAADAKCDLIDTYKAEGWI